MADDVKLADTRTSMVVGEWEARVELAALYRLVALFGWDDMIYTHISARVPGPEHHFLINPYGHFFNEITASSLVKIDLDGNIVAPTEHSVNPAGFTIHSAIHAAREDAKFVLHVHADAGSRFRRRRRACCRSANMRSSCCPSSLTMNTKASPLTLASANAWSPILATSG